MRPTTRILAGGAAALGAGILAVGPLSAAARDDGGDGGWVDDALSGLVDDGTLTQDQADAVADALKDARPDHLPGHFGAWGPRDGFVFGPSLLDDAAEAIGVDDDELLDALRDGETIAELAREKGVDPQDVIDAMVAAVQERLDAAVEDGDLDQDAAAERLADVTERITEFVNEGFELRERLPFPRPDGGWLHDRWGHWGPWDDETPDTTSPDTTTPDTTSPDTTVPGGD
jgi:polyhydroxyalkanoate synthesis regulator phasin